jgi:hypothetical protein
MSSNRFLSLFHHLFALGIVAISIITLALGRSSHLFSLHRSLGIVLLVMAALWIVRVAPERRGVGFGPPRFGQGPGPGNPVTMIITLVMLALIAGLAATGILMMRGFWGLAALHGIMSWALVGAVVLHLVGATASALKRRQYASPPVALRQPASQGISGRSA